MRHTTMLLLASLALAAACAGARRLDPERERQVIDTGEAAARALAGGLIDRLSTAIEEDGPAGAIAFCSSMAQPLTRTAQEAQADGIVIKRTSDRVRNPANAPDPYERLALRHFQSAATAGEPLPERLVQVVSDSTYRYYKPLVVAPLCVQCHGPRDALEPAVREALDRHYPTDAATGYAPGDFRGLIRVTIPERVLPER